MASFAVGISVPVHSPVDNNIFVIKTNTDTIFSELLTEECNRSAVLK
jgi:hypothetical protein